MIEPRSPVTIHIRHTPYPALHPPSDHDIKLKPYSIILRHRHLNRQYKVISRAVNDALELPVRKATRGIPVACLPVAPSVPSLVPPQDCENQRPCACQATDQAVPSNTHAVPSAFEGAAPLPTCPQRASTHPPVDGLVQTVQYLGRRRTRKPATRTTGQVSALPMRAMSMVPATDHAPVEEVRDTHPEQVVPDSSVVEPPKASGASLVVNRHEHSIRDRDEKTVWFSSYSSDLLDAPVPISASPLSAGDLFIHTALGDRQQVWMWVENKWVSVELHHPHPYLSDYVLNILSNGEPSWVRSETIRTYKGRLRKREREQDKSKTA